MKARRLSMIILVLVCAFNISYAQDPQVQESCHITLKPHMGVAVSNLSRASLKSRLDFSAGLDLIYMFNSSISLKSGVEYTVMGGKDGYSKLTLGYIDIPIVADIKVYKGLYAGAGIMCGINVHDGREDILLLAKTNKCNISIPIDVGCNFGKWVVDIRYIHGVTNTYREFTYKNRSILITLGYRIPI